MYFFILFIYILLKEIVIFTKKNKNIFVKIRQKLIEVKFLKLGFQKVLSIKKYLV